MVSSSFPIALNCQIKELLIDDFNLHMTHSRSGKTIKKAINASIVSCHQYGFGYAPQNACAFTAGGEY